TNDVAQNYRKEPFCSSSVRTMTSHDGQCERQAQQVEPGTNAVILGKDAAKGTFHHSLRSMIIYLIRWARQRCDRCQTGTTDVAQKYRKEALYASVRAMTGQCERRAQQIEPRTNTAILGEDAWRIARATAGPPPPVSLSPERTGRADSDPARALQATATLVRDHPSSLPPPSVVHGTAAEAAAAIPISSTANSLARLLPKPVAPWCSQIRAFMR